MERLRIRQRTQEKCRHMRLQVKARRNKMCSRVKTIVFKGISWKPSREQAQAVFWRAFQVAIVCVSIVVGLATSRNIGTAMVVFWVILFAMVGLMIGLSIYMKRLAPEKPTMDDVVTAIKSLEQSLTKKLEANQIKQDIIGMRKDIQSLTDEIRRAYLNK